MPTFKDTQNTLKMAHTFARELFSASFCISAPVAAAAVACGLMGSAFLPPPRPREYHCSVLPWTDPVVKSELQALTLIKIVSISNIQSPNHDAHVISIYLSVKV